MITSPDNSQLKLIRKLQRKRGRDESRAVRGRGRGPGGGRGGRWLGARGAAAWPGEDVEPELLDRVSSLGSGSRVVGVYRQRWAEPGGALSLYLHGVGDPGNVGTAIRSAHALCDGPVVLGPGCADPFSPKAVRAAMGSLFARPPARAEWSGLPGLQSWRCTVAAETALSEVARAGAAAGGAVRGRRTRGPARRAGRAAPTRAPGSRCARAGRNR